MIQIQLEGDIDRKVLAATVELISKGDADDVQIKIGPSLLTEDFFSVAEVAALAQCLSLVVKAILYVHKKLKEDKQWSRSRLAEVIDKEMLRVGVTEYTVGEIKNFGCLTGEGPCPCTVTILSATGVRGFQVCIFRDGEVFTIEVQHRLGLL